MSRFVIDGATAADVTCLASRLRDSDVAEIRAASGLAPTEGLRRSFDFSTHVWAVREIGGRPIALWGVGPQSLVEGKGCPWLLAAEPFERLGPSIARLSRPFLASILDIYPHLENRIDARHARAVRWLSWLGFTVDPAMPWGVEGRPFHRFWI